MLAAGSVFCLYSQPETIWQRLSKGGVSNQAVRPLVAGDNSLERIRELLNQRAPAYAQAHYQIATDGRNSEQVAEEILQLWQAGV